ncbi:MAG TPA: high-affinity branched-chain amino acid ABC transporter permease LivM [Alphaproteobacteria bacterium]|nr:high-affinity branched-chain amino acid ABC transporter permease LivM [Alphaproteobacteria bacterium]
MTAAREAGLAALVALILAVPLIGFRLVDITGGVTLETRFSWVMVGVAAVFVGRFVLALLMQRGGSVLSAPFAAVQEFAGSLGAIGIWVGGAVAVFGFVLPFLPFANQYIMDVAITVLIYVMLGWGLNIVVGLAGLLDLGYVAFYAVGAYSFALAAQYLSLGFWESLPLAGALAATFGILLGFPVLRLRGDYLAIVTLGFGEMIRIILLNWWEFTGGPNGLSAIPRPSFLGMPFAPTAPPGQTTFHEYFDIEFSGIHRLTFLYYIILLLALLTNWFTLRIRRLPLGRAWEALREDEIACRSLGINPTNTKLSAFALGAMFGGFAGSFFATRQGFISPESFTFIESATILAIVVLGGMGSQLGVVIAAAFLILLPEFGREFAQYRMLLFGAAMVMIMVWRPQGLVARREPSIRFPAVASAGQGR